MTKSKKYLNLQNLQKKGRLVNGSDLELWQCASSIQRGDPLPLIIICGVFR